MESTSFGYIFSSHYDRFSVEKNSFTIGALLVADPSRHNRSEKNAVTFEALMQLRNPSKDLKCIIYDWLCYLFRPWQYSNGKGKRG